MQLLLGGKGVREGSLGCVCGDAGWWLVGVMSCNVQRRVASRKHRRSKTLRGNATLKNLRPPCQKEAVGAVTVAVAAHSVSLKLSFVKVGV